MTTVARRRSTAARGAGAAARPRARGGSAAFLVITGLSGSGKSAAVKALEDQGAYCVDNLPVALLPRMLELARGSRVDLGLVVLGMDIRERRFVREFPRVFRTVRARGIPIRLLFCEASENVLVRRYSETRRVHPLGGGAPLLEAIREERRLLEPLRALADEVIDTTQLRVRELRERMLGIARERRPPRELAVTVLSFGYKYGVPADADLVFDVRFIANPFFEEGLRHLSGLDDPVREFVLARPEAASFLGALLPFLAFLVPLYRADGRAYLTIAFGCTGGRHRSPVITRAVAESLTGRGLRVAARNRDIQGE
ncbi:MAG TPA: RNase adapter RapZ [Candidatus Methanoperedens sp.]|nr:RNase adapter RapZ [Candidatus Methanoperedens sp.]